MAQRSKLTPEIIADLEDNEMTVLNIANKYRLNRSTVGEWRRKLGLGTLLPPPESSPARSYEDEGYTTPRHAVGQLVDQATRVMNQTRNEPRYERKTQMIQVGSYPRPDQIITDVTATVDQIGEYSPAPCSRCERLEKLLIAAMLGEK